MKTPAMKSRLNEFPSYKGGDTVVHGGYIYEYAPHHHAANLWGFVAQHRLVGEDIVGRRLIQSADPAVRECVHHVDEVRTHNHPSNLRVLTFRQHRQHHAKRVGLLNQADLTADQVKQSLEKHRRLDAAAKELCVHHQTLRNRFPDLVAPYLRSSPIDLANTLDRERLIEVLRYFAPTYMSFAELAKLTRVCAKQLAILCRKNRIAWTRTPLGAPGKKRMVYRGKPTRSAREACARQIVLA